MRAINLIVIHCSASPNGRSVSVDTIRQWHKARGFIDIGYHWVIDIDGTVDEGRGEDRIGAHAEGYNARSIGICLVGGVGGPDKHNPGQYSQTQWDSLKVLLAEIQGRYPGSTVVGHRDLSPDMNHNGHIESVEWIKLCPSFEVSGWLKSGPDPINVMASK